MNKILKVVVCSLSFSLLRGAGAETIDSVANSESIPIEGTCRVFEGRSERVGWINLGEEFTVVTVEIFATYSRQRLEFFWSQNTRLEIGNQSLPFVCHWASDRGPFQSVDTEGYNLHVGWNLPGATKHSYCLVFKGKVDCEATTLTVLDRKHANTELCGGSLSGSIKPSKLACYNKATEDDMKRWIVDGKEWCGIYQSAGERPWKLACFKNSKDAYELVYLDNGNHPWWTRGEVKASLEKTAVPGTFMATFVDDKRQEVKGCIVVFEGATVTIKSDRPINQGNNTMVLVKMFPDMETKRGGTIAKGGGTGFALKGGYFVTNYHVVENMDWVDVYLGDAKKSGKIVAVDKKNDLALVKTDHPTDDLPYAIKCEELNIGDSVRAFGFPLTATMGKNIKLTEGIVNSTTGFEDDYTMYQISAEVQPGNSGGPLVNGKGQICGIVSAKHLGAENVNYAIKAKYLKEFLERKRLLHLISEGTLISGTASVAEIKRYVARLECGAGSSN